MAITINTEWKKDMTFEANVLGYKLILDTVPELGGNNEGPAPKPLILAALAGCTGMDIIAILKKMKITLSYFNIKVNAELSEEYPRYYKKIEVIYQLGKEDERFKDKIEKAIKLSDEKYCGVSAQIRCSADIIKKLEFI